MPDFRQIHWFAPASMLGAFSTGVVSAAIHHLFYSGLAGTEVPEHNFLSSNVSRQQMNFALGTALAFLTKAALVYSMLIAYVQIFWRATAHSDSATPLKTLDSLYSAGRSIPAFCAFRAWRSSSCLLLVAAIAWYETCLQKHCSSETDRRQG